jgi:hypothetical protein
MLASNLNNLMNHEAEISSDDTPGTMLARALRERIGREPIDKTGRELLEVSLEAMIRSDAFEKGHGQTLRAPILSRLTTIGQQRNWPDDALILDCISEHELTALALEETHRYADEIVKRTWNQNTRIKATIQSIIMGRRWARLSEG